MYIIRCICLWMILGLMACSGPVRIQKNLEVKPEIFPDYADVTIPPNIAPLNFKLKDPCHSRMWPGEIRDQDRERRLFRDPGLRLEKAVACRFRESSECNRTSLRE